MDGRDLVRSVKAVGSTGAAQGLRTVRAAWRRRRADAAGLPRRGAERARVPARCRGGAGARGWGHQVHAVRIADHGRGERGGVLGLGRGGSGAVIRARGPLPGAGPAAVLEPDKDDGWRVVAERVTVVVSRHGAVEVRTPGGVILRRDLPPRWWEPVDGGGARWMQRSEVAADARFFGLGGRAAGPRLRDGTYRLWNTDPGHPFAPGDDPLYITMPVQMVAPTRARISCSTTPPGTARSGEPARGRGGRGVRARPRGNVRVADGRWPAAVLVDGGHPRARAARLGLAHRGARAAARVGSGTPSRALGLRSRRRCGGSSRAIRSAGVPLDAVHLDIDHYDAHQVFTVDRERFRSCRCSPRSCAATASDWCRSSTRRSRPRRATRCTTARSRRGRLRPGRFGPACAGGRMARGVGLSGLHARACAGVVGRPLRGTAGAGVGGILARHERADVVHGVRGVDAAEVGWASPGGTRR